MIMMKESPLISVGIPVYNEERFLKQTLASIVAIDYPNLEIIIVDNGSTDSSPDICRTFASQDPRILYHREAENRGAIFSWNKTFALSHGKYFFWSGGHDLWNPQCIALCCNQLEQHRDAVLAFPRTTIINQEGREIETMNESSFDSRNLSAEQRYVFVLRNLDKCNILHGLWRRSSLEGSVLFSSQWGPDVLLIAQMTLRGSFLSVPEAQWFRRIVRIPETQTLRDQRIAQFFNPQISKNAQEAKRILRQSKKDSRNAHYMIIRSEVSSLSMRIMLTLLTWYIFAVRQGLYPFSHLSRKIIRIIPKKWKRKIGLDPH